MDSSSENSFAWTDTSSDSVNSISMAAADSNKNANEKYAKQNGKKKKDRQTKIKKHDESDNFESKVIKEEETYSDSRSNTKKRKIKMEPDSENDISRKRKKIKQMDINENENVTQDSTSYDETYLEMKVKQEDASSSSKLKLKKHKSSSTCIDSSTSALQSPELSNEVKQENDFEIIKKKKKKKKSRKRNDSTDNYENIEDKMDIGETVISKQEEPHETNSKHKNNLLEETSVLLGESDESGCDEISAIKCDDSHSLHTVSFINKSIEEDNIKNNSLNIEKLASAAPGESIIKLQAAKHRKQRISDRIRFEDDDDLNFESSDVGNETNPINNKTALKLKQYLRNNPTLKPPPQTFNKNTALTQDDEIWILKCPKDINIEDFHNTTLNVHGKCKIKVGGQTYEHHAEEKLDTITLLTMEHSKYRICNYPLSGMINLRKRIPKAHFRDDNVIINNQTNFIPLPETKCRHPLFGSNYKKALKIPSAISERLKVCEDTMLRAETKKKNKKRKNPPEQVDQQEQYDVTMKTEPEQSVEIRDKKKKKRKLMDDDGPAPKKGKRVKHDPESAEAWESEKAIEENLFNF